MRIEAVRRNAAGLLQRARDGRDTEPAIAFPGQKHGRGEPSRIGEVKPDEVGERLGILLDAEEVALVLAVAGAAVAGRDGIDEHEIGEVEPARVIGDEAGRRPEEFSRCRSP